MPFSVGFCLTAVWDGAAEIRDTTTCAPSLPHGRGVDARFAFVLLRQKAAAGLSRGRLAPWTGVEPAAFRLGGGRSILLSYQGMENGFPVRRGNFSGGQPLFYPIPAALSTAHKKIVEKSSLSAILLLRSVFSHVIMCICV